MAISLTICNLALGDVRAPQISDPGEETVEAQYCRRYYPHCLAMMLDDYPWSFTKTVATLAALSTNERSTEWGYAYTVPADCSMAIRLIPSGGYTTTYASFGMIDTPPPAWWSRFIVENGVLYTNVQNAVLEYSSTEADEAKFPSLFREALRKLLAANLAVPLRDDSNLEVKLLKEAAQARESAIANDMNRAPVRETFDEVAWVRR